MPRSVKFLIAVTWLMVGGSLASVVLSNAEPRAKPRRVDPAAWGADHVGKPLPAYVTGDECLFCHRKIGPAWGDNRHQLTIRPATPDDPAIAMLRKHGEGKKAAAATRYLLGSRRTTRFLRPSKQYGKLELLGASFVPHLASKSERGGKMKNADAMTWDKTAFADRCAGCHTTAVNTKTRAFAARSLDCFACHGDVPLGHTKDVSRVFLSSKNREPRRVVSICGQCHLRGGKSKSSGLPYPDTFVAGDNLFRDFQVDFSDAAIRALPAVDRHIFRNARDVAVFGRSAMTCVTCHDVHGQSSEKHQQLDNGAICASCHVPGTDNSTLRDMMTRRSRLRAHSRVCDY